MNPNFKKSDCTTYNTKRQDCSVCIVCLCYLKSRMPQPENKHFTQKNPKKQKTKRSSRAETIYIQKARRCNRSPPVLHQHSASQLVDRIQLEGSISPSKPQIIYEPFLEKICISKAVRKCFLIWKLLFSLAFPISIFTVRLCLCSKRQWKSILHPF